MADPLDAGSRRAAKAMLTLARRAGMRPAIAGFASAIVGGVGSVLGGLWLKLIVDGATRGDGSEVVWAAIALGVTLTCGVAGLALSNMYLAALQFACGGILVRDVMRAGAEPPGIEHHERPEYADRVNLLRNEMTFLSGFLPMLGEAAGLAASIAVTALLMARVQPLLLLLPALALPSVFAGTRAEAITNRANEAAAQSNRLEEHLFRLSTTASPAKELRVFGIGDEIVCRGRQAWDTVTDTVAHAQIRAGMIRAAGWLPFAAGYLGAVLLALARVHQGRATAGDVLMVLVLASQVNAQVSRLLNLANRAATGLRVLRRYLWLTAYSAAAGASQAVGEPSAPIPDQLRHGIQLRDVSFRYPGSTDSPAVALEGITLDLPAGITVAIVGENGAGKTTLVKLLCRFYRPTSGSITVDGIDLERFDVDGWRGRLSGGFQDFVRFELLLQQAVGVGDIGRIDDPGEIQAALDRVAADLPLGLDAQLGREWPGGADLSEGQWQKVAMARAIMRREPLLVVLDEPTSGLDPHAEHALFELFAEVAATTARHRGTVTVLVSHRFSTVRMADHIVVLDRGRIVEQGSHESLLAAGGLYAELFGIQARAYR